MSDPAVTTAVLRAAFGSRVSTELVDGMRDLSPVAAAFLATHFDDPGDLGRFVAERGCQYQDLDAVRDGSVRRWTEYCDEVERHIRGDEAGDAAGPSVFGVCRRCGSARLFVTTRQLRPGLPVADDAGCLPAPRG